MLESLLIVVGGIGAMLAVGAWEKWRRGRGRVLASLSGHPAWEAIADELVRALRPLETEVRAYRDENEDVGVLILARGVDPAFKLRSTGRTTGDVETGHLGFDQQFFVQGATAMVRARLDGPTRDALLELLRRPLRDGELTVADASVEDDLAARAAAFLGPRMDAGVARATLQREVAASSARRRPAVARACTTALGHHGDPQDESMLLALVIEQRDEGLRLAAVRALGQLGSANAVPSLADLADSGSPDLRRAAREAIATIQSRLQVATPGQLSLHAGGAGQVTLADDAAGRLSEAPPKDE